MCFVVVAVVTVSSKVGTICRLREFAIRGEHHGRLDSHKHFLNNKTKVNNQ
jgi:hypothetical protein